jgi:uncharacterized protein
VTVLKQPEADIMERIQTKDRLREIMGHPLPTVPKKIHCQLNAKAAEFIQKSPLMFISTSDVKGRSTVAPKGDPAGFVQIVNSTTLRIPERKGNRLLMSLQNLLENDQIGLVFIVPGTIELLRAHGRCSILFDDGLCASHVGRGKPALLVMQVEIDECFFHCGKAMLRSDIWNAASWPSSVAVSFGEEIAENLMPTDKAKFVEEFDCLVQDKYANDL